MTAPFAGPPALPFDMVEGATQTAANPPDAITINDELAKLPRPRKHYQVDYTTREANDNMRNCPQGVHALLRAYYHYKSADWKQNKPFRLASWPAEELAKMPTYYITDLDKGMAETVASVMPTALRRSPPASGCLTTSWRFTLRNTKGQDSKVASRAIGARVPDSPRTCKHSVAARLTYPRYSSAAKAIGVFSRAPVHSRSCRIRPAPRCAASTLLMEPVTGWSRSSRNK
jgi:hypothetical protein